MAENHHKHGEMDISAQEKTFAGFMRWTVNIGIVCILIILFLAVFAR
ncbi:aa3-type cytochrome c oxidase subunit IV [Rhodobacterales bacterium HKCCSP123]|nr:aa3-type cytochrome c oxidase subunit IV [Rhodobacterales bacterium HKCCSP123]